MCKRTEDLTHQIHREVLNRCVEQVKTLAPILICSMKIFIQILCQDGKGVEEAAENRNYLCGRMSEELNEIIRVLQLTTYDEDEWDSDNLTVMKKVQNAIESSMQNAHDWLKASHILFVPYVMSDDFIETKIDRNPNLFMVGLGKNPSEGSWSRHWK